MRNVFVLTVAVTAALVAGCGDNGPSSPTVPTTAESTFTDAGPTTSESTDSPPAPSDASPKRNEPSAGAALTVTDIRIGHHEGFDRVVYDLGGVGAPGWIVQYTDQATQDGSGRPVDVAGQSILEVRITGTAYPFDSNVEPYAGPDPVANPNAPAIAGVYQTLVFEGTTQSFIGVNGDTPAFRVDALTDPTRLVIDIATG